MERNRQVEVLNPDLYFVSNADGYGWIFHLENGVLGMDGSQAQARWRLDLRLVLVQTQGFQASICDNANSVGFTNDGAQHAQGTVKFRGISAVDRVHQ